MFAVSLGEVHIIWEMRDEPWGIILKGCRGGETGAIPRLGSRTGERELGSLQSSPSASCLWRRCGQLPQFRPLCLPHHLRCSLAVSQMKPFLSRKVLLLADFITAAGRGAKTPSSTAAMHKQHLDQGGEEQLPLGWHSETHCGGA